MRFVYLLLCLIEDLANLLQYQAGFGNSYVRLGCDVDTQTTETFTDSSPRLFLERFHTARTALAMFALGSTQSRSPRLLSLRRDTQTRRPGSTA
jgi:hypothetical protein